MRLRRRPAVEVEPTPPVEAPLVTLYGYECPCGERIEDLDERALNEGAWAHARRCHHDDHVEARAADSAYGHPGNFSFDDGSPA